MTNVLSQAKKAYKEKGIAYVAFAAARVVLDPAVFPFAKVARHGRFFEFNGETYPYLYRRYNHTWDSERSVEVPIIWRIVQKHAGRILEVGNVLSHYFACTHDVIDKYEKGRGVANCDVVDYRPRKRYELVVSISTLEHVGFDPPEKRDPAKINRALDNLVTNCLAPSGDVVVTLPLGQNPSMDRSLLEGSFPFTRLYFMKRILRDNVWVQTDVSDAVNAEYGFPFRSANVVVVAMIT
jgi:hypothetical protein